MRLHRLLIEFIWLVDELLFYSILLRNSRLIDGYCIFLTSLVVNNPVIKMYWRYKDSIPRLTSPSVATRPSFAFSNNNNTALTTTTSNNNTIANFNIHQKLLLSSSSSNTRSNYSSTTSALRSYLPYQRAMLASYDIFNEFLIILEELPCITPSIREG